MRWLRWFNPVLSVGAATETVTVTTAPPVLDTESPILGVVMENSEYTNLPILMSTTQQRDPTAFASLVPGAQSGSRTPLVAGLSNYQGYLYLDGVPSETINQQGDNRTVSLSMSLEAVDQFQVLTSVPPAEYMGARRIELHHEVRRPAVSRPGFRFHTKHGPGRMAVFAEGSNGKERSWGHHTGAEECGTCQ